MQYPAIVYQRDYGTTSFADNRPHRFTQRYQVTLIDRNPDNDEILNKIAMLPQCHYNRFFAADGLNHDVFVIYF
jgi:hypothetical protein